ncbi:hypothetical protein IWQ56_006977, partial [Coemansia nantahalensis]
PDPAADLPDADVAPRKRKPKQRRGLLHAGSRDSIPDHIAALSHSTFPSPVPAPGQPERAHPWQRCTSPGLDAPPDRDPHAVLLQRPKTAAGHPAPLALAAPLHSSSSSSSGTLAPGYPADPLSSLRSYLLDPLPAASPRPARLTLVMQHESSSMRKQFVRALKDAAAAFAHEAASIGDSDTASVHPLGDSSSEILSLHPL